MVGIDKRNIKNLFRENLKIEEFRGFYKSGIYGKQILPTSDSFCKDESQFYHQLLSHINQPVNHDSPPVWPHNRPIQLPLLPPCGWISHYGLGLEV